MDNFKIIYKILHILEKAMDLEDFDKSCISKERLELTEARWNRIIAMLVAEGYVTGIEVWLNDPTKMVHRSTLVYFDWIVLVP